MPYRSERQPRRGGLFKTLCDHFEFGNMKGFRHTAIKAKLPSYADLAPLRRLTLALALSIAGPTRAYLRTS